MTDPLDISRRGTPGTRANPAPVIPKDSITSVFEIAAREDGGETSRMITSDVLPLYASLFANVPGQAKVPKNVKVTLVRWPYT